MKGFKDPQGKFHPITNYKGVRKSRDQTTKTQGVRMKLDDGFKGDTKIYIAKKTEGGWSKGGKPAPRPEIVDVIREMWNNDPAIKKLRKHVEYMSIQYSEHVDHIGRWESEKKKLTLFDNGTMTPDDFKSLFVHEVVGHTFWGLAKKWRREELVEFNELANSLPPVNSYVEKNKEEWKKWNDDHDALNAFEEKYKDMSMDDSHDEYDKDQEVLNNLLDSNGHDSMTRYANEQHSAVTEIIYGYHYHEKLINDLDLSRLVTAWEKLHY